MNTVESPDLIDAHHRWLGIPPEEQPPNYYRLLGLAPFEDDDTVIRNAAEQRQSYLRTFQQGHGAELSQQLLNEITQAKLCLLDVHKRRAYNVELRKLGPGFRPLPPAPSPSPSPNAATSSQGTWDASSPAEPDSASVSAPHVTNRDGAEPGIPLWLFWIISSATAFVVVSFVIAACVVMLSWLHTDRATEVASNELTGQGSPTDTAPLSSSTPTENESQTPNEQNTNQAPSSTDSNTDPSGTRSGTPSTEPPEDNGTPQTPEDSGSSSTDNGTSNTAGSASDDTNSGFTTPSVPVGPDRVPSSDPDNGNTENRQASSETSPPRTVPSSPDTTTWIDQDTWRQARTELLLDNPFDYSVENGELLQVFDQFMEASVESPPKSIARHAALVQARSVALTMLDFEMAAGVEDVLQNEFRFNSLNADIEACLAACDRAKTPSELAKLWWLVRSVCASALAQQQPASGLEVMEAFESTTRGTAGKQYRRWISDSRRDLEDWTELQTKLPPGSLYELKPDSLTGPQADLIGRWLCFAVEDWEFGLPFLAKSDNTQLSSLATQEIALRANPSIEGQVALANAWNEASSELESSDRRLAAHRATILQATLTGDLDETQLDAMQEANSELQQTGLIYRPGLASLKFGNQYATAAELVERGVLMTCDSSISVLQISPRNGLIAAGQMSGDIRVAELFTGRVNQDLLGHQREIRSIGWYPDTSRLISSSEDGDLKTFELRRGRAEDASSEVAADITQVVVGPRGRTVVGGCNDGTVYFWNGSSGKILLSARDHRRRISTLSISEDGRMMVSGSEDRSGQLWNEEGPVARLNGHNGELTCSALTFDGMIAATGDERGTIIVWNTTDGQRLVELDSPNGEPIVGVCFLGQWPKIAVLTEDSVLRVFDFVTHQWESETTLSIQDVTSMTHDRRGTTIAIGNRDGKVLLLEPRGKLLPPPQAPSASD